MGKYEQYYKNGDTRMSPLYLPQELYDFLDNVVFKLKKKGLRGVSRSGFIKALVQAECDKKRKYDTVKTEEDLINLLKT